MLLASGVSTYLIASKSANRAHDQALLNIALVLANEVRFDGGEARLVLNAQSRQILLASHRDRIHFAVYGPRGRLLAGEEGLFPENAANAFHAASHGLFPREISGPEAFGDGPLFFDALIRSRKVRGVVLLAPVDGRELTVLVAETLSLREKQVGDILLGIIVPESLLAIATIALILAVVGYGLSPLEALRHRLARRSPLDLAPVGDIALPHELKPLAQEIDRLLSRLDTALNAQRHFVADAAHQLRTPLAALQAQVESALQAGSDRAALENIHRAVLRLTRLVQQLLALARAEPGKQPLHEAVDLRALLTASAEKWLPAALAKEIDLGFRLEAASVRGSRLLLDELAGNLVDNAICYTPPGGEVTVSCGGAGDAAFLAVEDSGPGIPPAQRERVFERFFRGRADSGDGCGLGLAIVRRIADEHGATVSIGSAQAGGARVEVRFLRPEAESDR